MKVFEDPPFNINNHSIHNKMDYYKIYIEHKCNTLFEYNNFEVFPTELDNDEDFSLITDYFLLNNKNLYRNKTDDLYINRLMDYVIKHISNKNDLLKIANSHDENIIKKIG